MVIEMVDVVGWYDFLGFDWLVDGLYVGILVVEVVVIVVLYLCWGLVEISGFGVGVVFVEVVVVLLFVV